MTEQTIVKDNCDSCNTLNTLTNTAEDSSKNPVIMADSKNSDQTLPPSQPTDHPPSVSQPGHSNQCSSPSSSTVIKTIDAENRSKSAESLPTTALLLESALSCYTEDDSASNPTQAQDTTADSKSGSAPSTAEEATPSMSPVLCPTTASPANGAEEVSVVEFESLVERDVSMIAHQFRQSYVELVKSRTKPNVLIAGISGSGKSSLINSIFGQRLAQEGAGVPITTHFKRYAPDDGNVVIYDSRGLEHGNTQQFIDDTRRFFESLERDEEKDPINVVWYVINGAGSRIQPFEEEICRTLFAKIPLIFIINKADISSDEDRAIMRQTLEQLSLPSCVGVFDAVSGDHPPILNISKCPKCGSDDLDIRKKKGIATCLNCDETIQLLVTKDAVVAKTLEVLPVLAREAFVAAQTFSCMHKDLRAKDIIRDYFEECSNIRFAKGLLKSIAKMLVRLSVLWDFRDNGKALSTEIAQDLLLRRDFSFRDKILIFLRKCHGERNRTAAIGILWNRCLRKIFIHVFLDCAYGSGATEGGVCVDWHDIVQSSFRDMNELEQAAIEELLETQGVGAVLDREMPQVHEGQPPVIPQPLIPLEPLSSSPPLASPTVPTAPTELVATPEEQPVESSASASTIPSSSSSECRSNVASEQPSPLMNPTTHNAQQPSQQPVQQQLRYSGSHVTVPQDQKNAVKNTNGTLLGESGSTSSSSSSSPGLPEESHKTVCQQLPPLPHVPQQQQPQQMQAQQQSIPVQQQPYQQPVQQQQPPQLPQPVQPQQSQQQPQIQSPPQPQPQPQPQQQQQPSQPVTVVASNAPVTTSAGQSTSSSSSAGAPSAPLTGSPMMSKVVTSGVVSEGPVQRRKSVTVSLNSMITPKDALQRKQVIQNSSSEKEGIKLDANDLAELEAEAQREGQINEMEAANDLKKAKSSLIRIGSNPVMSGSMPVPAASALSKDTCPPVPRLPLSDVSQASSSSSMSATKNSSTDSLPSLSFGSPLATQSLPSAQPQPQ